MRTARRLTLLALMLVSAVVVVASPAFATPRLTTSTGTRPDGGAVSPFVSPIGDTLTNSITITTVVAAGTRRGSSFTVTNLARAADAITCIRIDSLKRGPADTHTPRDLRIRLPRLPRRRPGVRVDVVVNHISSSNPYYLTSQPTTAADQPQRSSNSPRGQASTSSLRAPVSTSVKSPFQDLNQSTESSSQTDPYPEPEP